MIILFVKWKVALKQTVTYQFQLHFELIENMTCDRNFGILS